MNFLKQKNTKPSISLQEKTQPIRKLFTALQLQRNTIKTQNYCPRIQKQPTFGQTTLFPSLLKVQSMESFKEKIYFDKIGGHTNKQEKEQDLKNVLQNFNSIRKQYDRTVQNSQKKQSKIAQLKQQIEIMKSKCDVLKSHQFQSNKKIANLNVQLQQTQLKQQDAFMMKKTLDHILKRMNKDKILYKIRDFNLSLAVKNKMTEIHMKQEEHISVLDQEQKFWNFKKKILKEFNKNHNGRQNRIEEYESQLQNLGQKQRQNQLINDLPNIQDQYNNPKQIFTKKILLVHQFLNKILKQKINRLLSSYQHIQSCYQKIKISTSVNDATVLVNKYFAQQSTYQKLLLSIQNLQKKLVNCKKKNQQLNSKYIRTKNQLLTIQQSNILQSIDSRQIDKINQKSIQYEFKLQQIAAWIHQNLNKIDTSNKHKQSINVKQNFITLCKTLLSLANESNKQSQINSKFVTQGIQIKKLTRMRTQSQQKQRTVHLQNLAEQNNMQVQWLNTLHSSTKRLNIKKK